jgi:hypothetical protein
MWVFPLAAAAIALVFAAFLGRQYAQRHRPFQLLWAIALLMYAAASMAVCLGVLNGWSTADYRVYWLFGAVLNVPYLAVGEVHLLVRSPLIVRIVDVVLVVATVVAVALVLSADVPPAALSGHLPAGKVVWAGQPSMRILASVYSYTAFIYLIAGTIWSAMKMRGVPAMRDRFFGTLGIAVGATIVAAGAAFAVKGMAEGFSITLSVGIAVMFWGFLRASRSSPATTGPSDD